MKTIKINWTNLIGCLASLGGALALASGKAQEVVKFADPANEMACFCIAILMSGLLLVGSFGKK